MLNAFQLLRIHLQLRIERRDPLFHKAHQFVRVLTGLKVFVALLAGRVPVAQAGDGILLVTREDGGQIGLGRIGGQLTVALQEALLLGEFDSVHFMDDKVNG